VTTDDGPRPMIMVCAICGTSNDVGSMSSLLTVRDEAGRTGMFAAHGLCVGGIMHPNARALLDAALVIPASE
jgi:hypothetical protein